MLIVTGTLMMNLGIQELQVNVEFLYLQENYIICLYR